MSVWGDARGESYQHRVSIQDDVQDIEDGGFIAQRISTPCYLLAIGYTVVIAVGIVKQGPKLEFLEIRQAVLVAIEIGIAGKSIPVSIRPMQCQAVRSRTPCVACCP